MNTLQRTLEEIHASVVELEPGFRMAQHPLYHTIWTHEDMDPPPGISANTVGKKWLRDLIAHKLEALENASANGNWESYVFIHERPWRVRTLYYLLLSGKVPSDKVPELIMAVWTDTEYPHQAYGMWQEIFASTSVAALNGTLDARERALRRQLPEMPTLYRGVGEMRSEEAKRGFSWTLDRDKARWFAERFRKGAGAVVEITVPKAELVGPLQCRGEEEMLILDPDELALEEEAA